MSSQLQWSILDVEEDEWDTIVGTARADMVPTAGESGIPACHLNWHRPRMLITIATLTAFLLLATYAAVQRAEQGLAHMGKDITVAVKAETLVQRQLVIGQDEHTAVESAEFLDGNAMAQVVVTQTLPNGRVVTRREARFYKQSQQGWSRTGAIAAFWGAPVTLDTQHLHFVFGAKDAETVTRIAADAEAYYVALRRIVGYPVLGGKSSSFDLLTIELVPRVVTECERPQPAWLRLTSPLLYKPALGQPQSDILAAQLREALVHQVLDVDTPILQPKAQWVYMALGLRGWLLCSDRLPLASDFDSSGPDLVVPNRFAQLSGLVFDAGHRQAARSNRGGSALGVTGTGQPVDYALYSIWQQAATVLDFVATEYSLDALGAMVQGFARYDDWETLIPATLGVSAQELEAGWLGRTVSVAQP